MTNPAITLSSSATTMLRQSSPGVRGLNVRPWTRETSGGGRQRRDSHTVIWGIVPSGAESPEAVRGPFGGEERLW